MAPRKILFLCNSDYGQVNVFLAAIYAIMEAGAPVEIHIGSFEAMEDIINDTIQMATDYLGIQQKIVFHPLHGTSQFVAMTRPELGIMEAWELPLPSLTNTAKFLSKFAFASLPWELEEFAGLLEQTKKIIEDVQPDLTVVDCLFVPGLTLAHHLKLRWTVLAPNTIKDFAVLRQPRLAGLWKYPVLGSALSFPVPWHQIPMNICLNLILAYAVLTSDRMKVATDYLRNHFGDPNLVIMTLAEIGLVAPPPPDVNVMVAMSEDLDYPFAGLSNYIIPLGPIVRPSRRLGDVDKELGSWLARGPTLYVNFGTQLALTPKEALEVALALKDTIDAADACDYDGGRKLQILWKLKCKPDGPRDSSSNGVVWKGDWRPVQDTLLPEIETARVRITSWIDASPSSILQSGHVVCSLHHGGANSWAEATCAGVPQVVVPAWIDCYDFGNRIEIAKVGIWANKKSMPRWCRAELGGALKTVILGPNAESFREASRRIATAHPASAGREKAASIILATLHDSYYRGGKMRIQSPFKRPR